VAERSRRIGSVIGYLLVSILGAAAGFGGVQLLAGTEDDVPVVSTTPSSTEPTPTSTLPVEVIDLVLSEVETVADALAVIAAAPAPPTPGLSVTLADSAQVGEVAGSTAFLLDAPELVELSSPFLPAADGTAPLVADDDKVVVMVALSEPISQPDGLAAVIVYEQPGLPVETIGPFAGTTTAVAARLGRTDVIGSIANADATFTETAPVGSVRIDGPLLTFVVEPLGPFRVVFARGFDSSLDNFGINPVVPGPALSPDQLTRLGDEVVITGLSPG
jgi:hypothetical protein